MLKLDKDKYPLLHDSPWQDKERFSKWYNTLNTKDQIKVQGEISEFAEIISDVIKPFQEAVLSTWKKIKPVVEEAYDVYSEILKNKDLTDRN